MMSVQPVQTAFLIDDSEIDLFIQKKFIEMRQFASNVVTFSSPTKALEVLTITPFDEAPGIIFLDLNMPIVNGFEFLERIKTISSGISNRIKVVILTSSGSSFDKERAKDYHNVISFISKPLTVQRLDELVHTMNQKQAG